MTGFRYSSHAPLTASRCSCRNPGGGFAVRGPARLLQPPAVANQNSDYLRGHDSESWKPYSTDNTSQNQSYKFGAWNGGCCDYTWDHDSQPWKPETIINASYQLVEIFGVAALLQLVHDSNLWWLQRTSDLWSTSHEYGSVFDSFERPARMHESCRGRCVACTQMPGAQDSVAQSWLRTSVWITGYVDPYTYRVLCAHCEGGSNAESLLLPGWQWWPPWNRFPSPQCLQGSHLFISSQNIPLVESLRLRPQKKFGM